MQVVVDGLLTTYESQGTGRPILLLHGWGDNLKTFDRLASELTTSYQVIRLDLPGFGQTQMPKEVWNLDNYAAFLAKFLQKLNVSEKVKAIIGHSNGGALAIRGLATGALQADSLILLAASGIRTGQPVKRFLLKIVAKVGKVATFWLPESKRRGLRKKLYGVAGSDMLVAPHLQETFKRTVRQDIQSDAKQLKQPTLLIYSAQDTAVPLEDGKKLAALIPGSKFIELTTADHFVHQTAAEEVTQAIQDFLQ